jgi:hypothetical protein
MISFGGGEGGRIFFWCKTSCPKPLPLIIISLSLGKFDDHLQKYATKMEMHHTEFGINKSPLNFAFVGHIATPDDKPILIQCNWVGKTKIRTFSMLLTNALSAPSYHRSMSLFIYTWIMLCQLPDSFCNKFTVIVSFCCN